MNECRKFRIEGRVQGVWFRESTRQQAVRLGVTGCAANRPDGSVEVVAWGSPGALDALAEWLRTGPPLARVHSVKSSPHAGERPGTFTTA